MSSFCDKDLSKVQVLSKVLKYKYKYMLQSCAILVTTDTFTQSQTSDVCKKFMHGKLIN